MKIINILVPDLPESVSDATVVTWHKKVGDVVNCDDNIVDIETDKVMLEVSSPCDGILEFILEKSGSIVKSQQILGKINNIDILENNVRDNIMKKEHDFLEIEKKVLIEQKNIENSYKKNIKYFTPSIRRLVKIKEIDSFSVHNTEIDNQINTTKFTNIVEKTSEKSLLNNIVFNINDNDKKDNKLENRVKMTRLRQRIAERLLESQKNTAMLTTFNEVNMKSIILLRKKYSESFEKKHGIRIGFMSFYVKAVVAALKKFPEINAYIDKMDIVYHKNFDISIAISTPRGLITPVLRNADSMSMSEIEKKIKEFSIKSLENKINIDELIGGNFTITNGGIFGSLMSTPIINPPQTAILGMHLIQDRPMAINGKITILPMMYLALSYDHRLIDGKESVSFLVTIKNILEDFTRILIDI